MDLNLMQVETEETQEHEALNFKNLIPDYNTPPFGLVEPSIHFSWFFESKVLRANSFVSENMIETLR